MFARAPLPKLVNAIGDRIGLDYKINRRPATERYIEDTKAASRLDLSQLRNTYYSLNESKTKKGTETSQVLRYKAKNPLKLNSRVRKTLYKLSNEEKQQLRYSLFEKVHTLWQQYAAKVAQDKDTMSIFRMDFHGCKLECTASKNPTLVGIKGIVVQETKHTFLIIEEKNRLLTLPKRESIIEFKIGESRYRIYGCNLLFTTQTRSKLKYKQNKSQSDI